MAHVAMDRRLRVVSSIKCLRFSCGRSDNCAAAEIGIDIRLGAHVENSSEHDGY